MEKNELFNEKWHKRKQRQLLDKDVDNHVDDHHDMKMLIMLFMNIMISILYKLSNSLQSISVISQRALSLYLYLFLSL